MDDKTIAQQSWPAATVSAPRPSNIEFNFRIGYGDHTLVIENPSGPDWVDLAGLDLGIKVPALIATARHGRDRTALWVRHRSNLLSAEADEDLEGTTSTIQLEDFPAGNWQLTWWDPAAGRASRSDELTHRGGTLQIDTPTITHHAAAWLERIK